MLWTWIFFGTCQVGPVSGAEYTNDFVVEINATAERVAEIAQLVGMICQGHISDNHWHFVNPRLKRRAVSTHRNTPQNLLIIPEVRKVTQQRILTRVKRDFYQVEPKSRQKRTFRDDVLDYRYRRKVVGFDIHSGPEDPLYQSMWYLNPDYEPRGRTTSMANPDKPGILRHMNVVGAWKKGYSGKGVVVTILDDGIEKDHPDLIQNYDPDASFDINDNDSDPQPRYNPSNENRHGTRCAGEVAASANNGVCVPGIAFNAKIGGIRMLDGDVTDMVEAKSIRHASDHVDIYSVSWGPEDDGKTVDGPAEMARKAFKDGITTGRKGKGSIYVWASGNGGQYNDNCNCDGYTNLMYTISISSTSEKEHVPWYSEPCASTLASTYSSGSTNENQIITTDIRKTCTEQHTGTSASAPIAAGIVALTLEANPDLGWRDVQHIIIRTSKKQLLVAEDWRVNGVNRWFSHRYGYGLMDAGAMVELAETWKNVPPARDCVRSVVHRVRGNNSNYRIEPTHTEKNPFTIEFEFKESDCHQQVDKIEHVIAKISLQFSRRGALELYLISPSGTKSMILGRRQHDSSPKGFNNFNFLTVHFWDENPFGKWKLQIVNTGNPNNGNKGLLRRFDLTVHGTGSDQYTDTGVSESPEHHIRAVLRNSNSTGPVSDIPETDKTTGKKVMGTITTDDLPQSSDVPRSSAFVIYHQTLLLLYYLIAKILIH